RKIKWGIPIWRQNAEIVHLAERARPDVLWVDKGTWVTSRTLRRVRKFGTRAIVHYTPDPAFLGHSSRLFHNALPYYDLVVTTKTYEVDHYKRHGTRELMTQYPSYDRDVHRPETPTAEETELYRTDLVFIGNYGAGREVNLRPLADAGFDLTIRGPLWDQCPDAVLRRHVKGGAIGGRNYSIALAGAKIALGLLSPLWPDRSTTRTLEIPACGAFLLAPRTNEHRALFEEGKEAEFFGSVAELVEKATYYLGHPAERARIAAAGRARCLASGYSSADRVREIAARVEQLLESQ
ncbi:MAG TPA: glycosyltransferase, partial [Fimbriiglobus sp.]